MIDKIEGIVTKEIDYKNTSKIIEVFTKEGIISIVAKGAKRIKSNLFNATTYLTYGSFCIYKKEGLSILKSVDVINDFKNIKKDIAKISSSSYLISLATQVYKQNNEGKIYELLISALKKINDNLNPLGIVNIIEVKYLDFLGVSLNLDCCSICGSKEITSLSLDNGGYLCKNCSNRKDDSKLIKLIRVYYYVDIEKIDKVDVDKNLLLTLNTFLTEYYLKYTGLFLESKNFFLEMNGCK